MNGNKVLEMLNDNKIDELKKLLQDEIYLDSLGKNVGKKERYNAMKRYFRFVDKYRIASFKKPCKLDNDYSFVDGCTAVLTSENIGEIEEYDNSKNDYAKVLDFFNVDGTTKTIDLNSVLAIAKSQGYKYNTSEIGTQFKYLFKYMGSYYKFGLLDKAFSIINDGSNVEVTYKNGVSPLLIKNKLGKCIVLPIKITDNKPYNKIVIELD